MTVISSQESPEIKSRQSEPNNTAELLTQDSNLARQINRSIHNSQRAMAYQTDIEAKQYIDNGGPI